MASYWTLLPVEKNEFYNAFERNISRTPLNDIKKHIGNNPTYSILSGAFIGRWDLLSTLVYDTPTYWWALLAVNDIEDPFDPNLAGQTIMIPNVTDIITYINSGNFKKDI